ncbi:hypothetical protein QR680_006047 [Steinernema hermaphroditum]|uniref:Nuclear receptor domain-containing protein n=1 Tax=Steinernema hermaphroditum TaxID=289476 RepID=A0AA39LVW1_9BILA|nr:hypothetical protein QR680_006047 [Steinernema hermaphroditum]
MALNASGSDEEDQICLVCGVDAYGIHCGVNSCRACAAFFRRSAEKGHTYKCHRVTCDCDISKNGSDSCKYCRFQKCLAVGMTIAQKKKSAKGEDVPDPPLPSTSGLHSLRQMERDLPEVTVEDYKFKLDADGQMRRVVEILDAPIKSDDSIKETSLQALLRAYENMVPGGKPDQVEIIYTISYRGYVRNLHEQMERIAKWAIHCREFAHLPIEDKRKLYCNFWHAIYAIERCARTTEFMGADTPPYIMLLTDSTAYDMYNYEYYMPEVDSEKLKSIVEHFKPFNALAMENLITPMKDLNLTTFELVYLCLYKVWNIKRIRDLNANTYIVAAKILDEASNELHEYYVNELRNTNYALRLSRICKLIDSIEFIYRRYSEIRLTADLCKVYRSSYGDSEFREYAKNGT